MLRYKTETRPGLVALYDIRPGNGAGQFLQPQSPHGAFFLLEIVKYYVATISLGGIKILVTGVINMQTCHYIDY